MLIADDEPDMRALVSDVLRRAEFDVFEAANAQETLAGWRQHAPDVIVLDHLMPPVSGFDIARDILAEAPDQIIFMYTALVDDNVRAQSDAVGITLCVAKDRVFELPELVRDYVSRA